MGDIMSLGEAARWASVADTSVRRWVQSGKLKAIRNPRGEWEIDKDNLKAFLATEQHARRGATSRNVREAPVPASSSSASGYEEALREAREALHREREIADELRAENRDLRAENRALQAEIRALLMGEHPSALSHGVRSAPGERVGEPSPDASGGHPPHSLETQTHPSPGAPPPVTPSNLSGGNVPLRSAFAEKVLALSDQGKTPEEIARALKKNIANVRAVLAHS